MQLWPGAVARRGGREAQAIVSGAVRSEESFCPIGVCFCFDLFCFVFNSLKRLSTPSRRSSG